MICSHFLRSQAKLVLVVASMRARARSPRAIRAQQGEALQPFCGALISTSTLLATMFNPDRAGSYAIEHEKAVDRTNRVTDRFQVVVGQDHAGSGFDVRGENHVGFVFPYCSHNVFNRCRGKGRLRVTGGSDAP